MIRYTEEQRRRIAKEAAGKVVEKLEYVDDDGVTYWVMTFTDQSEISFRFMAELGNPPRPEGETA